jgi:hypothetical protein
LNFVPCECPRVFERFGCVMCIHTVQGRIVDTNITCVLWPKFWKFGLQSGRSAASRCPVIDRRSGQLWDAVSLNAYPRFTSTSSLCTHVLMRVYATCLCCLNMCVTRTWHDNKQEDEEEDEVKYFFWSKLDYDEEWWGGHVRWVIWWILHAYLSVLPPFRRNVNSVVYTLHAWVWHDGLTIDFDTCFRD